MGCKLVNKQLSDLGTLADLLFAVLSHLETVTLSPIVVSTLETVIVCRVA